MAKHPHNSRLKNHLIDPQHYNSGGSDRRLDEHLSRNTFRGVSLLPNPDILLQKGMVEPNFRVNNEWIACLQN